MECNKYEAIRAREVAETKMQKNDFVGARKFALKAQQIYPDTDNITQLITVCDVHCASQKKIDAYEKDWYGILQVGQTADDSVIKKQYRKLALLLHPDKNKFPGAEAAFKLLGEAHRLLSDPVKRRTHDMKRKTFVKPSVPSQQPNNQFAPKQSFQGGFKGPPMPQYANVNLRQQHQPPAQPAFSVPTFPSVCPYCTKLCYVSISVKDKHVLCISCKKTFIAMEVKSDYLAKEKNNEKDSFAKKDMPSQGPHANKDKKAACFKKNIPSEGQPATGAVFKENVCSKDIHTNGSAEAAGSKGVMKSSNDSRSMKINKRKRKNSDKDSDLESESDTDEDEVFVVDDELGSIPNIGTDGLWNRRRSTRQKQKVSYDESRIDDDDDDDEELLSQDMAANVSSTSESNNTDTEVEGSKYKTDHCNFNSASKESLDPVNTDQKLKKESQAEGVVKYTCPDPEFNNFDELRKEERFKVGQVWALYDDHGAMPRFYGRIKAVYRPNKEILLTWLERLPDDDMSLKTAEGLFPSSCGKYSLGDKQTMAMDDGSFSHPILFQMGNDKKSYCIYPRRGQIWALFKNWNPNRASESTSSTTYEYEYVEVVSDYVEERGVTVAYLGKAKGYGSIFCRMDSNLKTCNIHQDEIARFSHMIPSFQLIGEERGVFELDPSSVPINENASLDLGDLKIAAGNFKSSFEGNIDVDYCSGDESEDSDSAGSESEGINCHPDPEFFNFESNKYEDKFKDGQIWAVYWEEDDLPKRYVLIQHTKSSARFKLVTKWLTLGGKQGDIINWVDKEMPAGCGTFKLGRKKPETLPPDRFSHIVNAHQTGKMNEFAIFPAKGEVWALYKDWKCEMNSEDIEAFEYEIVEVMYMDDVAVEVLPLQQDSKHATVFRRQGNQIQRIPKAQLLQFSHQIPAFLLTDELNGTLRGCWELDPYAVPLKLLVPS